MFEVEDTKWQLDVAEAFFELEARQNTILNILINAKIMDVERFNKVLMQVKEQDYFKNNFTKIHDAREELKKPFDFMDLLNSLGGKNEGN